MIQTSKLKSGDVVFYNGYPGVIKVIGRHRTFQGVNPDGSIWSSAILLASDSSQLDLVCSANEAAKRYASTLKVIFDE